MGAKIAALFNQADKMGGLAAKMKLAMLVRMSSTQAESVTDSPELVERVEKALVTLRAEQAHATQRASGTGEDLQEEASAFVLRRHLRVFADLVAQRALFLGDVASTMARVTEAAASGIEVARASVWMLEPGGIKCADLFLRAEAKHTSGTVLAEKDFPPYFRALMTERTIAAHDAHADPRTSCFSEVYLRPLGINSMLDVPIWARGKMVGVVCHEHVGPARRWTQDEERFAYLVANLAALALERA